MTKDELLAFNSQVRAVHESLGGKVDIEELTLAVYNAIGDAAYRAKTWTAFKAQVRSGARSTDSDGLVASACIAGMYVQRTLWSDSEYRFVIRDHMRRSGNERRLAYAYAEECRDRLGVWIDPMEDVA